MNSSKVYAGLTGCALAVAGLSGCFITAEPGPEPAPAPRRGTLTVTWTVAGSRSPAACSQFGADNLELVVFDLRRRPVTTANVSCSEFTLDVRLPPGDYQAEATLVDFRSRAITTTLPLRDVHIVSGEGLTIDIDFPSTSRL
jgi:hypothetical protein